MLAPGLLLALLGCDVHTTSGERSPIEHELKSAQSAAANLRAVVDAEDVRAILRLRARPMMDALNELGVRQVNSSAVGVLVGAWRESRTAEPTLNWDDLDRSDVRFALANELVRAHVNGIAEVPVASIAQFARSHLSARSDEGTLNRAMYLAVLAGDVTDIDAVADILLRPTSQTTFRAGVSALASVCSPEAATAIDRIRQSTDDLRKQIVQEVLDKSSAFREQRCRTAGP